MWYIKRKKKKEEISNFKWMHKPRNPFKLHIRYECTQEGKEIDEDEKNK